MSKKSSEPSWALPSSPTPQQKKQKTDHSADTVHTHVYFDSTNRRYEVKYKTQHNDNHPRRNHNKNLLTCAWAEGHALVKFYDKLGPNGAMYHAYSKKWLYKDLDGDREQLIHGLTRSHNTRSVVRREGKE